MTGHRHSWRPLVIGSLAAVVVAAGAYLAYELGRYQAGYSLLDERREAGEFSRALAERDAEIDELRRREAILETSREIDAETYTQVEAELARLQRRVQEQEEELAFYRGIVTPEDGVPGLKVQSIEFSGMDVEQHHLLRLVLVQAIVHNERVRGEVDVTIGGRLAGDEARLGLADLAADGAAAPFEYDFRYFQSFEQLLALPAGFEPDTVGVEIRPRESGREPVRSEYDWDAVVD